MKERENFERTMSDALNILKEKVDISFTYLANHPEEKEEVARLWVKTVKEFLNYGIQKSESQKGDNLFKRISKMFLFGR